MRLGLVVGEAVEIDQERHVAGGADEAFEVGGAHGTVASFCSGWQLTHS